MKTVLLYLILTAFVLSCTPKEEAPKRWQWSAINSPTTASLRGISALSENECWASGAKGTVLHTIDGGLNWTHLQIPGYDSIDFRDIHAFNSKEAIIMTAGQPADILRTSDGGYTWVKTFKGHDDRLFFDAIDFWDSQRGLAFSDALGTKLFVLFTNDGGRSWEKIPDSLLPDVHDGQGGFAASGTCLATYGDGKAIIGLGNLEATTLLTPDFGTTWIKSSTPLDFGQPSKGNYSFSFLNDKYGFCVGGDYQGDTLSRNTIAKTIDGGLSWQLVHDPKVEGKYRSCIQYINDSTLITVSRTGSNISTDSGNIWIDVAGSYYSVSVSPDGAVWSSGSKGRIAKLRYSVSH